MRAYRLAYDGRPFHGFQRQPDVPTVEGGLFDALGDLDVLGSDETKPDGYAAAGRTDAGVSARAQTIAFEAPEWLTPAALNGELPTAVRAWASADVPPGFHATHDARSREYVYYLFAPRDVADGRTTGDLPRGGRFDDERARATLGRLAGEHDFHNLTPDEDGTVRDLDVDAERDGDFFAVRLTADGFARQLVRRVVGLVAEVGRGESGIGKVGRVLGDEPLDGPEGIAPAPPYPLVLRNVTYDVAFTVDEAGVENARSVFADRWSERASAARVARSLCLDLGAD